jgi:Spy/CpxP family protein refolding chaperone
MHALLGRGRAALVIAALVLSTHAAAHGPGMPGPPAGGGLTSLLLASSVHDALDLTGAQEAQWGALGAAEQALHAALEASRTALHAFIDAQFAGGAPDLLAIDAAIAAAEATDAAGIEALRVQAVMFFHRLNTGQQAIVVSAAVVQHQHQQLMRPVG